MSGEKMETTKELWLVRHGQSNANLEGRFAGQTDVELTRLGEKQAASLRSLLEEHEFDGVWSSDLVRAQNTARLAYGEPVPDPRLREIHFGDLEGESWENADEQVKQRLLQFE